MITKAIRRVEKSSIQNEKDFYQTHPSMVKALRYWLAGTSIYKDFRFCDPCCGEGVIYKHLMECYYNMTYFDKFLGRKKGNFLLHKKHYDVIVFNPPYSAKYKFIDRARELADIVICLLPINTSNYNMFHTQYEDIPEFVGKIVMTPKMFLSKTTEFKTGGTSAYAWYIWDKNNDTDYSKNWYYNLREYL